MIDLGKEREDFEKENHILVKTLEFRKNHIFKQGEYIESSVGINSDNALSVTLMWQSWICGAERAQDEITELKQKLASYEKPDYVLVPRMPTKNMLDAGFVDGDYGCSTLQIYKAMIEAVEEENVSQNS